MAFLVTFVATDKSNPPEAKQKIEIPLPLNRSLGTFFRERKYPAGGKKRKSERKTNGRGRTPPLHSVYRNPVRHTFRGDVGIAPYNRPPSVHLSPGGRFQRGRGRNPSLFGRFKEREFLRGEGNRNPSPLKWRSLVTFFRQGKKVTRGRQKERGEKKAPRGRQKGKNHGPPASPEGRFIR